MNDKIKISVIMPVYNAKKYLKESIECVLNQTLKEIELICVDDGSTDNSVEIIEEYAKKDKRLKLVKQKNSTAGAARNNGLKYAHGEFIHYFDADDKIKLNAYEILWDKVKDTNIDFCVFQYSTFNEITNEYKFISHKMINVDQVTTFDENPKFFIYNSVVPWNKIIRKSVITNNNLKYDEIICANDRSFYFKLLLLSKKIKIINDALLFYRINNNGSLVGETRSKNFDCHFKSFYSYFPVYNNSPIEIKQMLVDVAIKDFLNFFNKADQKYKLSILFQIYVFFKNFDISIMGDLKPYSWNPDYQKITNLKYNIIEQTQQENNIKSDLQLDAYKQQLLECKRDLELTRNCLSLKIGKIITSPARLIKKVIRVFKNNGFVGTFKKINCIIKSKQEIHKSKRHLQKIEKSIQSIKNKKEPLIISFTSYPARIKTLHLVVNSLFNQTLKADKIILWLADSQFPNKENDLPQNLLEQQKKGLEIHWCEDIRSYKKLIPTLKLYPNATIVTCDDDNIFDKDWLKLLYASYLKDSNSIHCHRATKFILDSQEKFNVISGGRDYYHQTCYLNKLVGVGGVLYPPHSLYKDICNKELFMKLAPTNDDQWFWFMAILNNRRIKVVDGAQIASHLIDGTQETALCNINDHGENLFWKQFDKLIEAYPNVKQKLTCEYYRFAALHLTKENFNKDFEKIKENKKQYEYNFYKNLPSDEIPSELKRWYENTMHTPLNLENPKTFNEKIQWTKLYDNNPLKTTLVDKYLVRKWVEEKIGKQYLVKLIGVYDKFDDINFNKLPNKFVLKCNHGCGYNYIVPDKTKLDKNDARQKINLWMSQNFAFKYGLEMHYKNVKPKIICEEYLENNNKDLYDYKFFCFNGKVKFILFIQDRKNGPHGYFAYPDWSPFPYSYNLPPIERIVPKPKNLDLAIQLSEKLCKDFSHARADFYILNDGTIKFGEITFTSSSGACHWNTPKADKVIGSWFEVK